MTDRFQPLADGDPQSVGPYDVRARLGVGGMGRVYLAFTPGGRALAVKVVRSDHAEDDEFRRRFRKEIDAARRVQGFYTAPVVDADSEASLPWLATAYVPGPSLHQAVTEHGPLPLTAVFRLLGGVAEGLTAIHACGLVHRDVKPANVLLAADGPRLIDFGIAHAADATTLTGVQVRMGTPAFMAPEQILGHRSSPATDVFALGNLAVFAATGRSAFGEGHPEAMFFRILNAEPELGGCDPGLRTVVEWCLTKKPGDRPSVGEVTEYVRARSQGDTSSLAGAWLPESVATSLPGYATVAYTEAAGAREEKGVPQGGDEANPSPPGSSGPLRTVGSGPARRSTGGPPAGLHTSPASEKRLPSGARVIGRLVVREMEPFLPVSPGPAHPVQDDKSPADGTTSSSGRHYAVLAGRFVLLVVLALVVILAIGA